MSRACIATALRGDRQRRFLFQRRGRQRETKACAAIRPVEHRHVTAMHARDLAYHIEAEAGAAVERREAIERLENQRALLWRNAISFITDVDGRRQTDVNSDDPAPTSMLDRVLHEIGQRAFQCGTIAGDLDAFGCRVEREFVAASDRERCKVGDDALRDSHKIDAAEGMAALIEALDVEQLFGQRG